VKLLVTFAVMYLTIGAIFAMFITILSKNPRLSLFMLEWLCWPKRVYAGFKVIMDDAGKLDL
jgi:hypothetical protein